MPLTYILPVAFLVGCSAIDVGISIRDIDGDHLTECEISHKVASNKECMIEITFEKELNL